MSLQFGLRVERKSTRGNGLLATFVLSTISLLPLPTLANVQLTSFGVDNPPPPAFQPSIGTPSRGTAALAGADLPTHDATVGTLAGMAGTQGGAAMYSVPIIVPPGRAGMQPSLSLNYNSRGGDGVAGMGWTISGLSSIHRCPQTLEQDNHAAGVSYSANDRLCLDGQRLVAVSGTYGTKGAVYATEVDSHARITQIGGGLTGTTTCFRVEQKDGRVLDYGAAVTGTATLACGTSASSRVQPNGVTSTLSWLVQQIQDRVGNLQQVSYTDYGNGEVLAFTVTYTGFVNAGTTTPGNRTVTFAYQSRTSVSGVNDVSSSYMAGGLTMQTQALQSITTAVGGTTARTYTPGYVASQYNGRLLLATLTECASNNGTSACHPATQFTYNDDALNTPSNFATVSLQGFGFAPDTTSTNVPYQFDVIGDLDGDGTRETLVTVNQSDGNHVYLAQMTADRQIHVGYDITNLGFTTLPGLSSDIDGSGRAAMVDLPTSGTSNIQFGIWNLARGAIATSNPFLTIGSNISFDAGFVAYGQNERVYAADLDNDGKTDLLVVEADSTCGSDALGTQPALFFYRNTTSGQLGPSNTTASFTKQATHLFCLARTTVHRAGLPDTWYAPSIEHVGDFNGDGLPDIYMVYFGSEPTVNGSFAGIERTSVSGTTATSTLAPASTVLTCDTSSVTSSTDECNWQNGYFAHWIDVNGDGLEDFVIARPYQKQWQIRVNKGGTLAPAVAVSAPAYAGLDAYPTQTASGPLQGSGYLFRYLNRLPIMDVDADGKPEILIPQSNSNTTAGDVHGFALKMCLARMRTITSTEGCPLGSPTASMAASPAGSSSTFQCLMYVCPDDPGGGLNLPDNADHTGTPPAGPPKEWNNLPAYSTYGFGPQNSPPDGGDDSVYHLAALKFTQDSTGAFTATVVNTPIVSRLSGGTYNRSEDLFGDGLADLTTAVGCPNATVTASNGGTQQTVPFCSVVGTSSGTAYGPTTFPDGTANTTFANTWNLYGSINQGVAAPGGSPAQAKLAPMTIQTSANGVSLGLPLPILPGLLDAAVNGVGDMAGWAYAPLSTPGSQDGIPLYAIDSSYIDSRHYLFESSMPVVYGMGQSSGNGQSYTGFRSSVYGYGNAMYNHYGRGFAGFQTIVAETGDGTDTSGQHYRATRTTTTYNQKFPLTGTVAEVKTSARDVTAAAMTTVSDETDSYVCASNRTACPQGDSLPVPTGIYALVLDTQTLKSYDLGSGAQYAQVDTVNANGSASGWDAYGNLTYQTVTRADKGAPVYMSAHTTTTQNTFTVDSVNWWLDKLTQSSVTASMTYGAAHALPAGASAPSQTVTTDYTWNTDRTPATKTIQPGITNQQSTTTYTYPSPSYGLPTLTKICLGAYDANGKCSGAAGTSNGDPGSALSPERTTSFTYTKDGTTAAADGYYVFTTTNALNQTTTTTHEANDGLVLNAADPNGVQVVTYYDAFGRAIEVDRLDNTNAAMASAIQSAYNSCLDTNRNPGHCPKADAASFAEDGNEANAAYRVTTVQAGYPTQVAWIDLLGRTIKSGHRGFGGTFIASLTDYDDMGTAADTSTPYFIGNAPYLTGIAYDALNRPTQKIAPGSEADPTHGDVQTDYTYAGRTTNLTVHGTKVIPNADGTCKSTNGSLCLQMSRSQNALGQWMQTTQSPILNGTTQTLTTNYWTQPQGHIAAMTDAEGNITTASYNALGQRTQSADPDQGTWAFSFDALGELLTQTDARGVVTTINSRDALGRTTQRQQVPPVSNPAGLAFETELDDWAFDPVNGIGELKQVQRRRGAGRTVPSQGATPVWQESYGYEAKTARPSTITTTMNESGTVSMSSAMDYDSDGRPNTHTYPSGLVVTSGYTAYGQLSSLSNTQTIAGKPVTTTYWTATAENAWDHVTGETIYGSIAGTHQDYASTGQAYKLNWTGKDKFLYGYDSFGNRISQSRSTTASNGESFQYDALQRLTQSSRTTGAAVHYGYTASGNLKYKDNFTVNSGTGTPAYSYASANSVSNGCGPHAANSVALPSGTATYTCDANGNVIGGDTITATFDADNHPRSLVRTNLIGGTPYEPCATGHSDNIFCDGYEILPTQQTTGSATWAYDSNGNRYYESSAMQGTRYFGPAGYELQNGTAKQELGPVIVTGNNTSVTVVLRDRLGSTLDTIDGSNLTQRAYAPFGAARNGDMSDRANGMLNLVPDTIHGFTSHTHEDDVALIHMGGRIYDYNLGRFLSVDPIIQNPLSSQGLNPYSYIGNNPMSGKDPTGYASTRDCVKVSDCTDVKPATMTGSHIAGVNTGANIRFVNPTAEGMASLAMTLSGNGSVSMSSAGAGGIQNQLADAADKMALSNAPNTQASQPTGTMSATSESSLQETYDRLSQGNWFERASAGFAGFVGGLFAPFTSEDEFGNTHNPVTGQPIFAADARDQRIGMLAALPGGETESFVGRAIQHGAESRTATLIVGEGMHRVQAMAAQMEELGVTVRTYAAKNMNRLINPNAYGSTRSLNANWHWLDYWARKNGADVIDIGRQPGRTTASPYYEMESRNLKRWEQNGQITPVVPVNPGY